MNRQELSSYIIDFAVENNWDYEHVPDQIRAFFTTWCFINGIDADTKECDDELKTLYWQAALEKIIAYKDFESFMLEFIV